MKLLVCDLSMLVRGPTPLTVSHRGPGGREYGERRIVAFSPGPSRPSSLRTGRWAGGPGDRLRVVSCRAPEPSPWPPIGRAWALLGRPRPGAGWTLPCRVTGPPRDPLLARAWASEGESWALGPCPFLSVQRITFVLVEVYRNIVTWPQEQGSGASLVAQWLRIHLPMQGTRGSSPGPGRFHMPRNN